MIPLYRDAKRALKELTGRARVTDDVIIRLPDAGDS